MKIECQSLSLDDGFEQWSLSKPISYTELSHYLHGAGVPSISNNTIAIRFIITIPVPPRPTPTSVPTAVGTKRTTRKVGSLTRKRKAGASGLA